MHKNLAATLSRWNTLRAISALPAAAFLVALPLALIAGGLNIVEAPISATDLIIATALDEYDSGCGNDGCYLRDTTQLPSTGPKISPSAKGTGAQNRSPITFVCHVVSSAAENAESVYAADVDSDGDLDVLSASSWYDKVAWYENDGNVPPFFVEHPVTTIANYATSIVAADVDGDSDTDLLVSSYDGTIAWYENDGNSPPAFAGHAVTTQADGARSVFVGDIDGDRDTDVVSASELDNRIAWYENDGNSPPAFIVHTVTTNAERARSVYAADVDGDGDIDLLSASADDDTIAWYENDGNVSPTFSSHVITSSADGARWVHAADMDGDGDRDIVSASELSDEVAWYENDGGSPPIFIGHVISADAGFAHSVYAADLDSDGDMDVIASSWGDDKVIWYENDGNSSPAFTGRIVAVSADASVYAADIDGDENLDVLSGSYSNGRIEWWESVTGCEYAPLQASFEITPTTGVAPLTVALTNTSTGAYTARLQTSQNVVTDYAETPIIEGPVAPFLASPGAAVAVGGARSAALMTHEEYPEEYLQVLSASILVNGGFEDGSYSPDGNPTAWNREIWDIYRDTTLTWDSTEFHTGSKSVKVINNEPNHAGWIQTVAVEPHTEYRLSGWIKTENVAHTPETLDLGANLSVYDLPHLRVYAYVGDLLGTNDWTHISLLFYTDEVTELVVAARLGIGSGITTGTAWFDDLQLEPIHTTAPDLLNPNFETGFASTPDDWWTETIIGDAIFTWDASEAYTGSHSVKITTADASSVRWVQTVLVDPDSEYELLGWIKTEGVQPGTAEYTSGGAKLAVYGVENFLASATPGLYDTHGWAQVSTRFITGRTNVAKVTCTLGEADPLYARSTSSGTMWCDDLTLVKIRTLPRTYMTGEHLALDLYTEDWIFDDPEGFITRLDEVYEAMDDLVGGVPFGGGLITAAADASMYYAMLSGNPIIYGPGPGFQTVVNEHGIDLGIPHELGHDFDLWPQYRYYLGQMLFHNGQHWANFKVTYAWDVLGQSHPELTCDIGEQIVPLAECPHSWWVEHNALPWIADNRSDYWNMHNDTYTGLLYMLREQLGWQPFMDTFRHFGLLDTVPPETDQGKVDLFAHTLSDYAANDLTPHFRSWGFDVSPYIVSAWDFGDGTVSTVENPVHVYAEPGLYTVTLTVGGLACSSAETRQISVLPPANENGTLALAVDLQGRADDSGVTFTAWSGGQSAGRCTSKTDGTCLVLLPGETFSVTSVMTSYLDSVWQDVVVTPSQTTTLPTVQLRGGDVNGDCVVNILDLSRMGSRFGTTCGDPDWDPASDLNADCTLNILDLTMAGGNFGRSCPIPWIGTRGIEDGRRSPAQVTLEPPELTLQLGHSGVLTITVSGATGLYGAEAHLTFDPEVVTVVDADAGKPGVQVALGDLLSPDFVAVNSADNGAGTLDLALTQLSPTAPSDGEGALAMITFQAVKTGTSSIPFTGVILADKEGTPISAELRGGTVRVLGKRERIYLPLVARAGEP